MLPAEPRLTCFAFLFICFVQLTTSTQSEVALNGDDEDGGYDIESLYDFLAARGRRANDPFWAVRGKRPHDIQTREAVSNHLKPNGFIFLMGKRNGGHGFMSETKKNMMKPNGFNFLLANGKRSNGIPRPNSFLFPVKREIQSFNAPRPNGFMFPQAMGKRASNHPNEEFFNVPKPTSFFWPSLHGKRAPEETRPTWQNMVRPTGFMFSMAKGKKSDNSDDSVAASEEVENIDELYVDGQNLMEELAEIEAEEAAVGDASSATPEVNINEKRSMGAMQPKDFNTFFAGRGKKDSRRTSGAIKSAESFFAGRGKKGNEYDMFVAGRGK